MHFIYVVQYFCNRSSSDCEFMAIYLLTCQCLWLNFINSLFIYFDLFFFAKRTNICNLKEGKSQSLQIYAKFKTRSLFIHDLLQYLFYNRLVASKVASGLRTEVRCHVSLLSGAIDQYGFLFYAMQFIFFQIDLGWPQAGNIC